jgi:hypothetical protein
VNVLAARRAVVVLDIEDAWVNSKRKIRFVWGIGDSFYQKGYLW